MHKPPDTKLLPCCAWMLKELKGCRRKLTLAILLLLFSSAFGLAGSFVLGQFTDAALSGGALSLFWLLAVRTVSLPAGTASQLCWGGFIRPWAFPCGKSWRKS